MLRAKQLASSASVCAGGLMVDQSRRRSIAVDPHRATARVEAGATLGELDLATQAAGLATTAGVVTHTGVAGLTLGGGVGRLARKHGLACDNLLSVELETADARTLTADATDDPDLFWGLRGAGANFGVATSFTFRLHPVGPSVLGGVVIHPLSNAAAALRHYSEFCRSAPDELSSDAFFLTSSGRAARPGRLRLLHRTHRAVRARPRAAPTVRPSGRCSGFASGGT